MKNKVGVLLLALLFLLKCGALSAMNASAYKVFVRGALSLKEGNIEDAIKYYEQTFSLDKNAFAALKDLLYLYWRDGKPEKSFQTADRIDAVDGDNSKTTAFLALFYAFAKKPEEARAFWEKTVKLDPEDEIAEAYLASYYQQDNKLKEAKKHWENFLKTQPDNVAGYFQLAAVQEKLSMKPEALSSYNKVIELNPEIFDAYLAKARIYESDKKFDLALSECEKYAELFPKNSYALLYLGKGYAMAGKYNEAEKIFLKAKKELPNDMTAPYWLGLIYEKLGKIDKAVDEFQTLSLKEKNNVSVLVKLAYCYALLKHYSKAEKVFIKASSIEPSNAEIAYLAGLNYLEWKKYSKAAQYLEKAAKLVPDFADAYFYLGIAYDKNDDFEKSQIALLKAIEKNNNNSKAINYLGEAYMSRAMRFFEAERLFIKAISLEPQNGAYLDSLGSLYREQGKYRDAEKFLLASASVRPNPIVYEKLGDVYTVLSKPLDAWIAYVLAYDISQNKEIEKKLKIAREKISTEDLSKQTLLRSESNYLKSPSFKTSFKTKLKSGVLNKTALISFHYNKGKEIKIGFDSLFARGASISIVGGKPKFSPKAVEKQLSPEILNLIYEICKIFDGNFYKNFSTAQIKIEENKIIYSLSDAELVLNLDTALIEKFSQNGASVSISKYERFALSNIPSKISFDFAPAEIKGNLNAAKISFFEDVVNAVNSKSTGKN